MNTPSKTTLALIHHLVQAFSGLYPDESANQLHLWSLQVDDETPVDRSKDFCNLTLVLVKGVLMLHVYRLPHDEHVRKCLAKLMAVTEATSDGDRIVVPVYVNSARRLKRLANVVRQVAGPGRNYPNPNWFWVTRRASTSIRKLANELDEFAAVISDAEDYFQCIAYAN